MKGDAEGVGKSNFELERFERLDTLARRLDLYNKLDIWGSK